MSLELDILERVLRENLPVVVYYARWRNRPPKLLPLPPLVYSV
jgi:hypothetical protein